ncbi:MAG TPA: sirohydrochlorin chelatase [Egibacteraceae bacterium]|nr:sirohydrochlorin chelatase [Egibacteraceae bacterium]
MDHRPALLLIAHGTRNPRGPVEMDELVGLLGRRLDTPVASAWLEHDLIEPDPVTAAGRLVADGARAIVTLPFLVLGAGHAKTDVPGSVAAIHDSHPGVALRHGRVLGLHPSLFALARERVASARPWPEPPGGGEALLVTGAGSSDPDANGDLAKATRFLAETTGHRWAENAYAGVTWPTADVALHRIAAAGGRRVVRFSWSLLAGVLEERVDRWAAEAAKRTGIEIVDAGRFGPAREVAEAVADRYREALAGEARMNCDLCQFRLPLPGRERRAGLASAGGTGERVHPAAMPIRRADAPPASPAMGRAPSVEPGS